jgi:hypothetical protein
VIGAVVVAASWTEHGSFVGVPDMLGRVLASQAFIAVVTIVGLGVALVEEDRMRALLGREGQREPAHQALFSAQAIGPGRVEALAGWRHPRRGLLPKEWLDLAEDRNLLPASAPGCSARHAGLAGYVRSAVESSGLVPSNVILEITESEMLHLRRAVPGRWPACRAWVYGWPQTTSAPATAAWRSGRRCPSTSSRLTGRSFGR